jgi:1,4-dihydroxy-2-naphthoate octaprenyltransferase
MHMAVEASQYYGFIVGHGVARARRRNKKETLAVHHARDQGTKLHAITILTARPFCLTAIATEKSLLLIPSLYA